MGFYWQGPIPASCHVFGISSVSNVNIILYSRKMQLMVRIPSVDSEENTECMNEDENDIESKNRKLKDLNEWAIIEMQGDLESRIGDVQLEGKFVGDLHFTKAGQIPVLIIGHHILYGKVVKLEKPLVIMEKCQNVSHKEEKNCPKRMETSSKDAKILSSGSSKSEDMENDEAFEMLEENFTKHEKIETVYNVRAIIRKKLLFKSRPKPIIANVPKKI